MRRCLLPLAVVLLCAGCSSAGTDNEHATSAASSALEHRKAVQAAVAAVSGATARIDEKITIADADNQYVLTVAGGFDLAKDQGNIAVDLPGGAISHSDEIFAGDKVYVALKEKREDTWGVMLRDEAEAHYLLRAPLNDPEHVLGQVSSMREISKEGQENVRGGRATHYRGVLDHGTLTKRMAQDARKRADQMRDALGGDLPVFVDAWVNGDSRLVQARMTVNMSSTRMTVTMGLSDFGKPVHVTVPKAENTVPMRSATGVLSG